MTTIFNYTFKDKQLLKQALRHSSAKTETLPSNERLEFLGDSVLGLTVAELLYNKFPQKEEGELTLIKSEVVSQPILARIARETGIDRLIEKGKGMQEVPESIMADAVEAILGAIFLEAKLQPVQKIINEYFLPKIDEINQRPYEMNYKALLQHYTQKEYLILPEYKVVKATGPAHKPVFEVMVRIGKQTFGPARGATKKEAEQKVARMALDGIKQMNLNRRSSHL